jgi:hypothetical protein
METEKHKFSFCESVHACPQLCWHIRKLDKHGLKPGGGVTQSSLCGLVKVGYGWDLDVPISDFHLGRCCSDCRERFALEKASEVLNGIVFEDGSRFVEDD